jgi:ABC-type multidrug transport system ATPase subunit
MLKINSLSKTYPNGVRALKEVTLEIPQGMFGLLGPNGAGKSTLMRTIATLQEADEGSIHFGEINVLKNKNEVRKILGYLPQDFGVYPKVTAEAMLDHFAVLKGITQTRQRREIVRHLLQVTNLYEVRNRKLGTFSGGMKQRFGIAQALIGDPRLIIVDEPTAGLDPEERNRFLNLLGEIGENIVVILSTHIVADVEELCRRMAIISEGTLLLSGDPHTVIAGLQGKIWQKLIAKNELEACKDVVQVISTRWFGGRVVIHAWSEAHPGAGFEPVEADLQDVYFTTLKQYQAA